MRPQLALPALTALALGASLAFGATSASAAPERPALQPQVVMGVSLHPSGNDRTVENGGSGTQGWAMHDPDGDYNYGVDQNGDAGGVYTGDQDGNNGCGNDQDFEDDNNGMCGGGRPSICIDTSSGYVIELPGKSGGHRPASDASCDTTTTTTDTDSGSTSTDTSSTTSTSEPASGKPAKTAVASSVSSTPSGKVSATTWTTWAIY